MRFIISFLLLSFIITAQNNCEFITNVTDSIGTLKETKSVLVHEKVFGNNTDLVFLSLVIANEIPLLKVEIIQKNTDYIAPKCFNKNSKLYFQLANSKIYTFLNAGHDACSDLLYNTKDKVNNRILVGNFFFKKDEFDDFENFSISMMRIKFSTEIIDYILPKSLVSETLKTTSSPENFFKGIYKCL